MARNRTPNDQAFVSGAILHNPGRFKHRQIPGGLKPLGDPYPTMTASERGVWHELAQSLPWLRAPDRLVLRMVCKLSARMDAGDIGVQASSVLSGLLSKLGATPVDQCRVHVSYPDDDDDEFFGGTA